tara:strand:+ start:3176 stop:3355 length:180 start_codon:yes stop_codon:yes gene_type:complete
LGLAVSARRISQCGPLRATFDNWMWLQPDGGTLINRAYMSKYGIDIGEILIFFRRDEAL